MIKESGMFPYLSRLLQGHRVVSNKLQLQKMAKEQNNCGRWAYLRIKMKDMSLKKFQQLFSSRLVLNPDSTCCLMTSLIF